MVTGIIRHQFSNGTDLYCKISRPKAFEGLKGEIMQTSFTPSFLSLRELNWWRLDYESNNQPAIQLKQAWSGTIFVPIPENHLEWFIDLTTLRLRPTSILLRHTSMEEGITYFLFEKISKESTGIESSPIWEKTTLTWTYLELKHKSKKLDLYLT